MLTDVCSYLNDLSEMSLSTPASWIRMCTLAIHRLSARYLRSFDKLYIIYNDACDYKAKVLARICDLPIGCQSHELLLK